MSRIAGAGRFRPTWGWLALPLAFLVWFCQNPETESEVVLLTLEADSSFQAFSRLWVGFHFEGGKDTLTLFDDSLERFEDLRRLSVPNRRSGKGTLVFRGFEAGEGRLVYSEIRVVDMADGELLSAATQLDLRSEQVPPPSGAATIDFPVRDTTVSIGDTVTLAAILADSAGNLRSYAWDFSGAGTFSAPFALDNALDTVFGTHVFADTGVHAVSLKVVNEQRRETLKSMTVRVLLDEPEAKADGDSEVTAGDTVRIRGEGEDALGRITGYAWKIGDQAFQASAAGDTSFAAPLAPGILIAILRVTDDDGLSGFDTLRIEVLPGTSAFLGRLALQGARLSPDFEGESEAYSAVVGYDAAELIIELKPAHAGARISVSGGELASGDTVAAVALKVGANDIPIVVTAQDNKTKREYGLTVTRLPKDNGALKSLQVSHGALSPAFDASVLDYADTVASTVSSITVTAAADPPVRSILIQDSAIAGLSGSRKIDLAVGGNDFSVVGIAEDGTRREYRLSVHRQSGDASLSSLDFLPELPGTEFRSSVTNYSDTVDFGADSLRVTAAGHSGATIRLNAQPLSPGGGPKRIGLRTGANSILIQVFAEDTAISRTYEVDVWRRRGYVRAIGGPDDETGSWIAPTSDGGFAIAGSAYKSESNGFDALLVKTNAAGDTAWSRTFGGAGIDGANVVLQASDGGFFVAGKTVPPGRSDLDLFWFKTDPAGNKLWDQNVGGAGDEAATGIGAHSTRDGGFILCSQTESFGSGAADIYVLKIDAGGDTVWTKTFGGTGVDVAFSIVQTRDDGFVLVGRTSTAGGANNLLLLKLKADGDTAWSRTLGGEGGAIGVSVALTADNGFILTGQDESKGGGDALLVKTDSLGNVEWSRTYGGSGADWGRSVLQNPDGGYIVAGYESSGHFGPNNGSFDAFLMRVNSSGEPVWTSIYGGEGADFASSVTQTTDNGFIAIGTVNSTPPSGGKSDIYLIRTDGSGDSD